MVNFIAKSDELRKIVKSLALIKNFFVSSLLIGEESIGKKTLAKHILPQAVVVSGEDLNKLLGVLDQNEEVIITNFEKISNYHSLNFDNKRVIATATYQPKDFHVDDLFGYIYEIRPLKERLEDAKELADLFYKEAKEMLSIENEITLHPQKLDLSQNSKSLKKYVYKELIQSQMNEKDLRNLMYEYLYENLEGNNDYKKFLYLYEKPLLEAGLKRYGSQLKLSAILGINRNTLRKKVNEYGL